MRVHPHIVGANGGEVPPVPIPNTEVKLTSAENTWREAAWEDRAVPTRAVKICSTYSSLAQSVEHAAVNRRVVCSSQTGGAKSGHTVPGRVGAFAPTGSSDYTWAFSSVG